ncbi:phage exclusion protein Lit family protein [Methylorubrum extorquens]|uniref:phage exclusion protein Lit family protein n=1 Tax=Methylorubrum extorquens TaxID=408 RepID=UPI003F5F4A92
MLDVSKAIDLLFGGAAPERLEEINVLWGDGNERAFLSDRPGFLLEAGFEVVQVNEIALRQIWVLAYALSRAADFYAWPLLFLAKNQLPFDLKLLAEIPDQAAGDAAFDQALDAVAALAEARSVDDVPLPVGIPVPAPGVRSGGIADQAGFDLACMASAYVFLHEVRHVLLARDKGEALAPVDEEIECDRFARSMMLDGVGQYARDHQVDPAAVTAKRVIGILFAKLAILAVTPVAERQGSDTHPAVRDRIRSALDAAPDPAPDWFWVAAAGAVAALTRALAVREGHLLAPVPFPQFRDLAQTLLHKL